MNLPPFPVDDQTLALLWDAMHPDPTITTEQQSVHSLLDMIAQLGGSDTAMVLEVHGDIDVMRDPLYHIDDVVASLIIEVRRLRGL
jgi:hypothetical protein